MLGNVPDERLQRRFIKALGHPVERRAEVVHKLLARVLGTNLAGQCACLLDVGIAGLDPEKICVGSEFLGTLGRSREPGTIVVEAFAGTGAVPGPNHGRLGVVVGKGSAAGDRQIGVLLDMVLVCITGGLGSTLGLKVSVDSWVPLAWASKYHQGHHTLVKGNKLVLLHPCKFESINLSRRRPLTLHGL